MFGNAYVTLYINGYEVRNDDNTLLAAMESSPNRELPDMHLLLTKATDAARSWSLKVYEVKTSTEKVPTKWKRG
jgi:hypothetical protein